MLLTDSKGKGTLPCEEITATNARALASPLAGKILSLLAKEPEGMSGTHLAKQLRETEQKVHYHVANLRRAGAIVVDRIEDTRGASAKILRIAAPALAVRYAQWLPVSRTEAAEREHDEFLRPFIRDGVWDARIVVGSPDPHGPESARSRDAAYAIDLGLFFGARITASPNPSVVLDTELHDWNANLVIIGGPVVNKAAERLTSRRGAPILYDSDKKAFRTPSGTIDGETAGIIVKMPNPFAPSKHILWIAGKRHSGTRAAILAFLKDFAGVCSHARHEKTITWIAVEGVDEDSDGIVDKIKFLS